MNKLSIFYQYHILKQFMIYWYEICAFYMYKKGSPNPKSHTYLKM